MNNIKTLQNCMECKLNRGQEDTFVCCGRTKQYIILVPVTKNKNEFIVDCDINE
jgi:hypothetical protein